MPFRDESEQLREQLRRSEEKVTELEEREAELRKATEADRAELSRLRRRDAAKRFGVVLAVAGAGIALGSVPAMLYVRAKLSAAAVYSDQLLRKERATSAEAELRHAAQMEKKSAQLEECRAQLREAQTAPDPLSSTSAVSVHVTTTAGTRDASAIARMRADFARCLTPKAGSQGGVANGGTELSESERKCIADAAARAKVEAR